MKPDEASPYFHIHDLECAHAGPFSLDLGKGECVVIRGPSGAGKSVLLRMIADLDPGSGGVKLEGRSRDAFTAPDWRRSVVYQAAEPGWWEHTAGDHFSSAQMAQVQDLLERLGLGIESLSAPIGRLSTGERQRMALIRSLACRPKVLLLDEPTSALDPLSILAVESLLADQMKHGMSLILVTHSGDQAQRLAGRIVQIEKKSGTP